MHLAIALYLPAVGPVLAAGLAAVRPGRAAAVLGVVSAGVILAAGIILAAGTRSGAQVVSSVLRADALTAFLLIVVGAVAVIAGWSSVHYLHHEASAATISPAAARRYLVLIQLFLACMCLAVLADNLGLLWIAVEATTVVTAFLVGHHRTRASVEAAWKYVVLCSIGIAIAFLGTIFVYAAAVHAGATGLTALDWSYLSTHTATLDPGLIRLAAGLALLGFGTKAGLAPMHWWLPDAHSQAPAPVSALMSGVLLSVAFYAILRYKTIIDPVLGPAYVRTLLLVAALASLVVAALLLIAQRDYKRLLAYSSIEHMGLIALGTAIGGQLALTAVLLHMLGHGLAKSVAFCSAGQILHRTGSTAIDAVRGLAARTPGLAGTFGVAVVALLGLPPFSLFASELGIARAGFGQGYGWAVAIAFTLVLLAFTAIARHAATVVLGPTHNPLSTADPTAPVRLRDTLPLIVGLGAAAGLGVTLGPLRQLLDAAAHIAGGR